MSRELITSKCFDVLDCDSSNIPDLIPSKKSEPNRSGSRTELYNTASAVLSVSIAVEAVYQTVQQGGQLQCPLGVLQNSYPANRQYRNKKPVVCTVLLNALEQYF